MSRRFRTMRWSGDSGGPWSESAERRFVRFEYDGLELRLGSAWNPKDIEFILRLPNLRHFGMVERFQNDVPAFLLPSVESLTLVTGSSRRVPDASIGTLERLVITDRPGVDLAKFPNVSELRVGRWKGRDLKNLASPIVETLHLEGIGHPATLDGAEFCSNLRILEIDSTSIESTLPLRGLNKLEELKLLSTPAKPHQLIDLAQISTESLRKVWVSHANKVAGLDSLAQCASIEEVRLISCGHLAADSVVGMFRSGVKIEVVE